MSTTINFGDKRLTRRHESMIEGSIRTGKSPIHNVFKNYNDQKSSYRFLSNPRITEDILIENLSKTCAKAVEGKQVIGILDTSTITLDKYLGRINDTSEIGRIGRNQHSSSYGFFLHPLFVVEANTG